jgi:hypothetical protein
MRPRSASFIWSSWAIVVARLGYAEMTRLVARAIHLGFIERHFMGMDDFKRDLRRVLDNPTGMAGFADDDIKPFVDAIGELSPWYAFSDERCADDRSRAERALSAEPAPSPRPGRDLLRYVGRNDPCPCGSGKKFKKCCLAA